MSEMKDMWRCPTPNCGYIYDPDRGSSGRLGLPGLRRFQEKFPSPFGRKVRRICFGTEKAAFGLPFLSARVGVS